MKSMRVGDTIIVAKEVNGQACVFSFSSDELRALATTHLENASTAIQTKSDAPLLPEAVMSLFDKPKRGPKRKQKRKQTSKPRTSIAPSPVRALIIKLLTESPKGMLFADIKQAAGNEHAESSVRNCLASMKHSGLVYQTERGSEYRLTQEKNATIHQIHSAAEAVNQ